MDKREQVAREQIERAAEWLFQNRDRVKEPFVADWSDIGGSVKEGWREYARGVLALFGRDTILEEAAGAEYLIWSNEHKAWWAPDRCGYTRAIDRAGRYSREEAIAIARSARGGWEMAGLNNRNPPEIAIPLADALEQNRTTAEEGKS